uniref:Uncharacterized protein n=1 Tax=Vespula pensylvanica TaxID=30213 RepID=A0A834P471_VESPE|nr:hypothetical protein H0235_007088 [Vespula pensylvanica]
MGFVTGEYDDSRGGTITHATSLSLMFSREYDERRGGEYDDSRGGTCNRATSLSLMFSCKKIQFPDIGKTFSAH